MIDSTWLVLVILAIAADVGFVWYRRRAKRRAATHSPLVIAKHPSGTRHASRFALSLDAALFILTALVFLFTRLVALDRWPIYFFTDEAANTVQAAEFLSNGLRDANDVFLPTYFQNAQYLSLSSSVYAQVIPTVLFGNSVFVTRAVAMLIALSGTLATGLILRDIFKLRGWWIGSLLLSITPAWFLHSRTAFEHPLWVAFYAWFLYFYLRYRTDRPRHLMTALVFGALSFYAYNGGQPGVVVTGLLLLSTDARYHWHTLRERPRLLLAAAATLIAVTLPYLRFYADHSNEITQHLRVLDSYWTTSIPLGDKLSRFGQAYWQGLRFDYWFTPDNTIDLIRHQMKGYAQLPLAALPFFLLGLVLILKKLRSAEPAQAALSRVILIALFIAPIGGALVSANILRNLVFVVPAVLLMSIGVIAVLDWLARHSAYRSLAPGLFIILSVINGAMLYDAVINGPTWYHAYDLNGLQYGGKEVFEEARRYLAENPGARVWIAPTWLNGPDTLRRFFVPADPRVRLFDLDAVLHERYDVESLSIMLVRDDYQRVIDSGVLAVTSIERTLPYPDGTPGFYLVRLAYTPQADASWAAGREARSKVMTDTVAIDGQMVMVTHSMFDMGTIANLFDGDPLTLVRTQDVNPAVIDLEFAPPRIVSGVRVTTGSMNVALSATVSIGLEPPTRYTGTYTDLPPDPTVELTFDRPRSITRLRLEIANPNGSERANVHVREIELR